MQVRYIWYVESRQKCVRALMHWKNTVRHQNQQFFPTPLGKSLVTAYENLNIDLARPAIRARMESDMNESAHGRKSRLDVVKDWMGIMTPLLKQCMDKVGQLKGTLRTFFQVLCPLSLSPYKRAGLLAPLALSHSASRQKDCSDNSAYVGATNTYVHLQPTSGASFTDTIARNFSKCGDCDGNMRLKRRNSNMRNGHQGETR